MRAATLLKDISQICAKVEPDLRADALIKRLLFMGYELQGRIDADDDWQTKLQLLNAHVFERLDFSVPTEMKFHDPLALHLVNRVLTSRIGAPRVLALIYSYLGEQIGLNFEFVDLQPNCYLKYIDHGVSHFIDLSRKGRIFSNDDLLETMQRRSQMPSLRASDLLETVSPESFMVDYLVALKDAYKERGFWDQLLIVQNAILDFQPSNLSLVGERALILSRMGHLKGALSDLKRYFSFHERERAPSELVGLFDELHLFFKTNPSNVELID